MAAAVLDGVWVAADVHPIVQAVEAMGPRRRAGEVENEGLEWRSSPQTRAVREQEVERDEEERRQRRWARRYRCSTPPGALTCRDHSHAAG